MVRMGRPLTLRLQDDRRPLSIRVRDRIWEMLKEPGFGEGSPLPSEAVFAGELGVSRSTVREALRILEDERVILVRNGVGRFVAHTPDDILSEELTHLKSTTELMRSLGDAFTTKVLSVVNGPANADVQRYLSLPVGEVVTSVKRIRIVKGEPVIYSSDHFAAHIARTTTGVRALQGSLFKLMENKWGVQLAYTKAVMTAALLNPQEARNIGVDPNTAWVVMDQVHYSTADIPVLYSHDMYRGDKMQFSVLRRRR